MYATTSKSEDTRHSHSQPYHRPLSSSPLRVSDLNASSSSSPLSSSIWSGQSSSPSPAAISTHAGPSRRRSAYKSTVSSRDSSRTGRLPSLSWEQVFRARCADRLRSDRRKKVNAGRSLLGGAGMDDAGEDEELTVEEERVLACMVKAEWRRFQTLMEQGWEGEMGDLDLSRLAEMESEEDWQLGDFGRYGRQDYGEEQPPLDIVLEEEEVGAQVEGYLALLETGPGHLQPTHGSGSQADLEEGMELDWPE